MPRASVPIAIAENEGLRRTCRPSEMDVACELLQPRPSPCFADIFLDERDVAKRPAVAGLLGFVVEVILNLALEVALQARSRPRPKFPETLPNAHIKTPPAPARERLRSPPAPISTLPRPIASCLQP